MKNYSKTLLTVAAFAVLLFVSCNSIGQNENSAQLKTPETVFVNRNEPIKIIVSTNFGPKSIEVTKGQPVKLAFLRQDNKNCGDEVIFPQ
jgi:plastocyanin domain-containing protein